MFRLPTLIALAAACKSNRPAAPPPVKAAAPAAADPWAGGSGASLGSDMFGSDMLGSADVPAWTHDPPIVLRDKINGVNAHVVVLKTSDMPEYRDVMATAEHTPGVTAAEPFIFLEGDLGAGSGTPAGCALKAVDPARVDHVLAIGKHMTAGSLAALHDTDIVLGDDVAKKLGAKLGDRVTFTIPALDDGFDPQPARSRSFRLTGTFHMDFDEYDGRLAIATLPAIQAMLGRGDQAMGVEMSVADVEHADAVAKALEAKLGGPPYQAMDWYQLNTNLFHALYGDKRP